MRSASRFVSLLVVLPFVFGAIGCSTPIGNGWTQAPLSAPGPSALGAMQTRDRKVTFLSGQRLRIEESGGGVVADKVTLDELRGIDPFLHAACTSATAKVYLDARLDLDLRNERR